jgi:transposase
MPRPTVFACGNRRPRRAGHAEAIAEAATRPTMRFVTLTSAEQLDMQTLHRARDQAVRERTSLMNQLRAVLLERGVIVL